jgi:hypothetical protein
LPKFANLTVPWAQAAQAATMLTASTVMKMSRELKSTIHLPETAQNPPQLLA